MCIRDRSRVGRYKYNKKLGISGRLAGHTVSRPIVNPLTGELMAEAGERLNRARAMEIEDAGVSVAYVTVEAVSYTHLDVYKRQVQARRHPL